MFAENTMLSGRTSSTLQQREPKDPGQRYIILYMCACRVACLVNEPCLYSLFFYLR